MKSALYFADEQVRQTFVNLPSGRTEENEIYRQLNLVFDTLALDPFSGGPKAAHPENISIKIRDRQPVEIQFPQELAADVLRCRQRDRACYAGPGMAAA